MNETSKTFPSGTLRIYLKSWAAIQSGQLISFGRNSEGQLGRGHTKAVTLPGTVKGMQVSFSRKDLQLIPIK